MIGDCLRNLCPTLLHTIDSLHAAVTRSEAPVSTTLMALVVGKCFALFARVPKLPRRL